MVRFSACVQSTLIISSFFTLLVSNCLGIDLCFLRPISMIKRSEITKAARPTIILVILDIVSRFTQLRVCKNGTAAEIRQRVREALPHFAPNNHYRKIVSDRGSENSRLGEHLGLTHYHIQQGPWRKVSIGIIIYTNLLKTKPDRTEPNRTKLNQTDCLNPIGLLRPLYLIYSLLLHLPVERQIRSYKRIFFHLLLRFPTVKNYQHLIHLTQISFNSRTHRSTGFSPHFLQTFDYAAGVYFRKIMHEDRTHQEKAFNKYQLLRESQKLRVGDKVRIRNTKPLIRKESAVFYPQTTESVHTITKVDTRRLPYSFEVDGKALKYYGWHLVKISPTILSIINDNEQSTDDPTSNAQHKPIIKVQNIIPQTDSNKLRSGKTLIHSYEMTYDILKDGERQFVDKEILQLYKRLFGSRILQYDNALLNDPQKSKHII